MGYPVVEVYRLDARTIELTQRRFKLDHLTPERAEYRNAQYWYKWDIPIFYDVNGKKMDMVWLHEAVRLPINISDTFLINPESLGYYRVNYDEQMWTAIADQLKKNHKLAFEVISYLPNEKDYLPWISVLRGLENLYGRLSKTELEDEAKKFVSEKLAEFFKSLDLDDLNASDNSKVLESQVRKRIAVLYCDLLPEECRKKLVNQFESNFMAPCESYNIASDCSKVSPSIRPWVYCVGLANGGEKEFEKISKLFTLEVDAAEKRQLLAALSCSRDPRKLRKLLHVNMLSEASPIPEQDVQNLVESMNNQDVGAEIVSDFMLDNWKEFMERFSHDKITLSNVLRSGIRLESERDIKQFERFLADHSSTTLGLQVLKLQLEKARNQVEWLKKNKETMKKLLSSTRSEKEL
ncbi:hypothetical protein NECAME_08000 [Necator americanus]|uniref:ERAP1-like C-terminal domain-containing protein n=1 Tax=Necator americanus TaxID=51031 RepID=W2TJU7_NECAM|nr:hypothetical protein NECAME_08000 [Necator americanus]ETN82350.1 hypothetical protein NECAME_08000 [Necator americanus]